MSERGFVVREAIAADLPGVVALERGIAEAAHWPANEYEAMLAPASDDAVQRRIFVAERDGVLCGYAVGKLLRMSAGSIGELENIAVAVQHRGQGVGRALCCAVLDWCRQSGAVAVEIEVRAANRVAIAMYESLGWKQTGLRRDYYHDPVEDAIQMTLVWGQVLPVHLVQRQAVGKKT